MIRATFKNADGSIRILNWYSRDSKKSALEGKNINDLINDFRAESCSITDYDKPQRKRENDSRTSI